MIKPFKRIEYISLLFVDSLIYNIFEKVQQIEKLKSDISRISQSESNSGLYDQALQAN